MMPFILNCSESHPFITRFQTDLWGFKRIAEIVRAYPDTESVKILERKRIEGRSYVIVERTILGFGHNFEPEGEDLSCPACGSDKKLKVLSATL